MSKNLHRLLFCVALLALSIAGAACSDEGVGSDEEARRAYLGLDPSIAKSLNLGFAGFNSASSANIAPQTAAGDATGTLTITGQVDQGASDNKGMRLFVGMVGYSDGDVVIEQEGDDIVVHLTYDTSMVETEQPFLNLSLRNIPTGDFTGTLMGTYHLEGDIDADVTLNLMMSGTLQDVGGGATGRAPGTTTITGTATSGDGLYEVNVTL
jgi:hypothetical protein